MIFLPNKNKHKKSHHGHSSLNPDQNHQIQMMNLQQQQQANNMSRQQIIEMRRNQISRNEQKNREKMKDTILKVLAFTGSIFLLAGIGLLIFGIVQSQQFGYIAGGVMIGLGVILIAIMIVLMCTGESDSVEYEMRGSHSSSRTQVTPNY